MDINTSAAALPAQLADALAKIENLERALLHARRIGMATGIVMATGKLAEDEAFQVLVRASQSSHRKLREVADQVVYTGASPALD